MASLLPIPAPAITGNDFNTLSYNVKGMYIIGLDDGIAFMGGHCNTKVSRNYEQTLNAVLDLLEKHPDRLSRNMADIYAEAIINAFDCEQNPKAL
jgi:hypothetical protein